MIPLTLLQKNHKLFCKGKEGLKKSVEMRAALHMGKLGRQGRLNAVVPGSLVHIMDQLSNRRFRVDTGASYSIFPHTPAATPSGHKLRGEVGQLIPCWGEKTLDLSFQGRHFSWTFLLAAVSFPIIGVDFLLQTDGGSCS
jgi:hypothetical protein